MSKEEKRFEVLNIKVFLDTDLHLYIDTDFNVKVFDEDKLRKTVGEFYKNLYDCGTGLKENKE